MELQLTSSYKPTGDQPQAISQLTEGILRGDRAQVLLGVTGSGKTFTVANVIQNVNKPTLILSHNKTLAAQLYGEFKQFFPENAVEYFISYYDYYQPEAFIATTNTYIEKDLMINQEIDKLRLSTVSSLMSGRRDIIVIASVSCIYGAGNPQEFKQSIIHIKLGDMISRNQLLFQFVEILYSRTEAEFSRGTFRVKGDTVDIYPSYADFAYRIVFFGEEVESLSRIDPISGKKISTEKMVVLFPANLFVTGKEVMFEAMKEIQDEMMARVKYFESEGRLLEAQRIQERTEFDLEMMRELGYCSGIENYSRFFDKRKPGERPFCLLDYFPDDFLLVVDESHASIPQIRAMWGGDRSRKEALVDYGFRLPSAMDNRPLTFNEFEQLTPQTIFVSATPADYELRRTEGIVVEQIIRPTGLLDPKIDVRPSLNQIDDLLEEIHLRVQRQERVLITTLTKRMAEELSKYLEKVGIKGRYIHSEVKTMDRVEILRELRLGVFDVLVGVNLLREGLDLPEVSLVAILDADKEGFLRSHRSLTQTVGRAARNVNGKAIMYADKITDSMQKTIDETNYRRTKQINFNLENNQVPQALNKKIDSAFTKNPLVEYELGHTLNVAAEAETAYLSKAEIDKLIREKRKSMEKAAKELDFMQAAKLRDEIKKLQEQAS